MGKACIESIPYSDRAINIMKVGCEKASAKAPKII